MKSRSSTTSSPSSSRYMWNSGQLMEIRRGCDSVVGIEIGFEKAAPMPDQIENEQAGIHVPIERANRSLAIDRRFVERVVAGWPAMAVQFAQSRLVRRTGPALGIFCQHCALPLFP